MQVRSDFRSTILWLPDVKTDADGTATVKVKYPDSLTTWSATARVVDNRQSIRYRKFDVQGPSSR